MKIRITISCLLFCLGIIACQKETGLAPKVSEHFYLRSGGSDMPVFVNGNSASKVFILLLHGGPGDGGLKYRHHTFSNLLEKEYAMVYWDQRHQGNTQGHSNESEITIDQMVEDTYLLIKTLKKRYGEDISLFLMGHSWGGTLGTAFMIKEDYQNEVNGWIESAGAHDFPLINKEAIKMFNTVGNQELSAGNNLDIWNEVIDYTQTIDTNNISLEQALKLNQYAGICENLISTLNTKTQTELGDFERYFLTPDNPVTVTFNGAQLPESFFKEIINTSLTDKLHKIHTPTLLMWGLYDFKVPKAIGEKAFQNINSTDKFLKVYNQSGHSSMRYEPELFVHDFVQFIETYK